jgi:hypothetical protein
MTLPTDIILPLRPEQINSADPAQRELYTRDLIYSLTRMYQDIAQNVNGDIREYSVTVEGSTTAGSATYTNQTGIYLRQGLMVDVWFNVTWSGHTGSGDMYVTLPYQVFKGLFDPWVGELFVSTIALTGGYTGTFGIAFSESFKYVVVQYGSGLPALNLALPASGSLYGHVRYVGTEFEN